MTPARPVQARRDAERAAGRRRRRQGRLDGKRIRRTGHYIPAPPTALMSVLSVLLMAFMTRAEA